jgi:hypothetical protein
MIILRPHDYAVLPWMPAAEWREPSLTLPRDQFRRPVVRRRFRLRASTHDGLVRWTGWFDSREDADAFLTAIIRQQTGGAPVPRSMYDLPSPHWDSDLSGLLYQFADITYLTGTSGSNQTWTVSSDWNPANNRVDCIAPGGSGGRSSAGNSKKATGGSGGAHAYKENVSLTPSGSVTYRLPAGAASPSSNGSGVNAGDCWFNGSSLAGSSVGAKGGLGGGSESGSGTLGGAVGGLAASCVGDGAHNGGSSGSAMPAGFNASASGGGAAGGPNGDGASSSNANGNATSGAAGDSTAFDGVHTPGSGGDGSTSGSFDNGDNYGGGGGGRASTSVGNSGAGGQALIVISNTPGSAAFGNIPMMGL